MKQRPLLLDLFCGAGGASAGYQAAGFDVVGVDIVPQLHYPYMFEQCDALEYLKRYWFLYDAIHASPPCQAFTPLRHIHGRDYPDLLTPTISLLESIPLPWVVENVEDAPLDNAITLCGRMFDLMVYRHRLFASNIDIPQLAHPIHTMYANGTKGKYHTARILTVAGHNFRLTEAQDAMGIDWMNCKEIAQAIPPRYTEYIGCQLLKIIA